MLQSASVVDETFFMRSPSEGSGPPKNVEFPNSLQSATQRLGFPPSYVVVGVYCLLSNKALIVAVNYLDSAIDSYDDSEAIQSRFGSVNRQ
jgi:hypothetical protein